MPEKMAGTEITSVIVGIAGGHIRSLNGHGMITLRNREKSHGKEI